MRFNHLDQRSRKTWTSVFVYIPRNRYSGLTVCTCMYVYMYVYVNVCMYVCSCPYICMYIHVCIYVYIYIYIQTYIHTCIYVCIYTYIYTCNQERIGHRLARDQETLTG